MGKRQNLAFSISATTRPPRGGEKDGREYHFRSEKQFRNHIDRGELIEWEQVYRNAYYGTLKSEVHSLWERGDCVVFDVDVRGGISLKNFFASEAISFFIAVENVQILKERLLARGFKEKPSIEERLEAAHRELELQDRFDEVIVNASLDKAVDQVLRILQTQAGTSPGIDARGG